jgi:hypothetical protein
MAPELRTEKTLSSGLKKVVPERFFGSFCAAAEGACGPSAQQAVDGLCVTGGKPVDTKSCVRPDSCIAKKIRR